MADSINADRLKANITNTQRTYLWEVVIPNPLGGGDSEALLLRAQSATIPGRSFGDIHVPYKNTAGFNIPGKVKYTHSWQVVFVEGEDAKIREAIVGWMQQITHDQQMVGLGDPFIKKTVYMRLLGTDGSVTKKIELIGAYPSDIADVSVDYESENVVKYQVTWKYDRWQDAN